MPLNHAVAALNAHAHCGRDVDWCVAYDGLGPHAYGVTPGRMPNIHLAADDAIRLAAEYEHGRSVK